MDLGEKRVQEYLKEITKTTDSNLIIDLIKKIGIEVNNFRISNGVNIFCDLLEKFDDKSIILEILKEIRYVGSDASKCTDTIKKKIMNDIGKDSKNIGIDIIWNFENWKSLDYLINLYNEEKEDEVRKTIIIKLKEYLKDPNSNWEKIKPTIFKAIKDTNESIRQIIPSIISKKQNNKESIDLLLSAYDEEKSSIVRTRIINAFNVMMPIEVLGKLEKITKESKNSEEIIAAHTAYDNITRHRTGYDGRADYIKERDRKEFSWSDFTQVAGVIIALIGLVLSNIEVLKSENKTIPILVMTLASIVIISYVILGLTKFVKFLKNKFK